MNLTQKEVKFLERQGHAYVKTLGAGVYGKVTLVEKKYRRSAIKLSTEWKTHQHEELILRTLNNEHPNIVKFLGSWSSMSLNALKLEFVPGRSLLEILMEQPLSESQAHPLFCQLVYGVNYAHETQAIAHRDLKAENLMISGDFSRLTIIDWGMAMFWDKDKPVSQSCGSPDYAAPEIFQHRQYIGPEIDIWSMGVILYAMVTSRFPFPGETPFEVAYRVSKGVYVAPSVSPSLNNLISQMLTVSQRDRITIQNIFRHAWFQGPPSLEESSERISNSNESLRASNWRPDVYDPDPELKASAKEPISELRNSRSASGGKLRNEVAEQKIPAKRSKRFKLSRRGSAVKLMRPKAIVSEGCALPTPHAIPPGGPSSSTDIPDVKDSPEESHSTPKRLSLHFWKKHLQGPNAKQSM